MRTIVFYYLCLVIFCWQSVSSFASTIIPRVIVTRDQSENHHFSNAAKTTISQEDIAVSGVTTLAQVLQELGGVQLLDQVGNGSRTSLSMRGFGANANSNTLLLINGLPVTNPDMAPPDLNAIPIQEIEYVEVIAGSESVLYGDQAVGGIINIVTRRNFKNKMTLAYENGSYNHRQYYATWNDHYRALNYGISAVNHHSDNYRDHNQDDQNLTSGHVDYAYQTGNVGFNYILANDRMQYPGALTAAQVFANRRQAKSPNDADFFKNWNGFYHLQQQQTLNSNWRLESDLARREMHGNGVLTSPFTQSRVTYFFKPQLKGVIGKTLLTSGLDFENDDYHLNTLFGVNSQSQQKYGVFSIANIPLTSRLSLLVGARGAEQRSHMVSTPSFHRISRALVKTIGLTFQLLSNVKLYIRAEENYRFPKADENSSPQTSPNGLKTQRGVSYEGGMQWDTKKLLSKFSIYQLNLENEIMFDPTQTAQNPFGTDRNLDPTVRRGLSLIEKYQLTDRVNLNGQYNYVRARFQSGPNSGNRIPLVSESILRAGVDYAITQNFNFYTEALYTGNQFAANDDANVAGKVGGYTTYNVNFRYHWHQLEASFRVNNVFNKYYYFYTVYMPSVQNEFFYPAPGRNILFTVKYLLD